MSDISWIVWLVVILYHACIFGLGYIHGHTVGSRR